MANRIFRQPLGSLENDMVTIYGNFAVGSTGAVGTTSGKGVTSVTRDSAGQYTVLLQDSYDSVFWASAAIKDTANSDPSTVGVIARWEADSINDSTPTVQFQFFALDDGAVADPASGAVVYFKLELRNSSVS